MDIFKIYSKKLCAVCVRFVCQIHKISILCKKLVFGSIPLFTMLLTILLKFRVDTLNFAYFRVKK